MATGALYEATQLLPGLQAYWWPFCRLLALFSMAPMYNHRAVNLRLRILLALVLTLAMGKALPTPPPINPLSVQGILVSVEQILFGILLGVMLQLVFAIFSIFGEVVSTQMGMSMARYNDPMNGVSSASIIYQLYFVLLVLLYFCIDGHLVTFGVLYQSFTFWPVASGLSDFGLHAFLSAIAWMFSAAVLVSLPVFFCLLLVQFCFGLLNRISPAMNLFSLGFPFTILAGMLCIYLTVPEVPQTYLRLNQTLLDNISATLRGP